MAHSASMPLGPSLPSMSLSTLSKAKCRALSGFAQQQQAFFDSSHGITHVLGFHPLVPHPCSLVKGVFEPSDRWICPLNTDTNRRIVWHQSSHCWVAASVRIAELGLCIGRLSRYVIVLWMACSSSSL